MGSQYRLEVENKEFLIDILLYQRNEMPSPEQIARLLEYISG